MLRFLRVLFLAGGLGLLLGGGRALAQGDPPSPTPIFPPAGAPTLPPLATPTLTSTPSLTPSPSPSATPSPKAELPPEGIFGALLANETPLAGLSLPNYELASPLGSAGFTFQRPSNWYPDGTSTLTVHLEYFENLPPDTEARTRTLLSIFDIELDGALIGSVSLGAADVGQPRILNLLLPNATLRARDNGRHVIRFTFRGEDHCAVNSEARVLVRSDMSFLRLEYREQAPVLDLARYPSPIYFGSLGQVVENVVLVLPSAPMPEELQTAAYVAAGLGKLTFNDVRLLIRTADALTPLERETLNAVYIGTPERHPLIADLFARNLLTSSRTADGDLLALNAPLEEGDGLIELVRNPANPLRTIAVATATDLVGLEKAALALSTQPSAFGVTNALAVVTAIAPLPPLSRTLIRQDVTRLSDLTGENLTLAGLGAQSIEVEFVLSHNESLQEGAYLDLRFRYSRVLEDAGATFSVLLNNDTFLVTQPLNSTKLEQDINGDFLLRVPIPRQSVLSGVRNVLSIVLNTEVEWTCNPPDDELLWMSLSPDTSLYLPRQAIPFNAPLQVASFPAPFNQSSDLSDVWISLPSDPTLQELEQGYRLVARLAASTIDGGGFKPRFVLGEAPPESDFSRYHFIVVGRVETNPLMLTLNESLPQPFDLETGLPRQVLDGVTYRLPTRYDLGILQIIHSPWSPLRQILVLTGTSAIGQNDALSVFLDQTAGRVQLRGDVVFVSGTSVSAVNTSELESRIELLTSVPDLSTEAVLALSDTPSSPLPVFTATFGPTPTPTFTRTPSPVPTATPLFTLTPSPTVPTPIPTFPPLPPEDLQPAQLEAPSWLNTLALVTVGVLVFSALFGAFTIYRSWRRSRV